MSDVPEHARTDLRHYVDTGVLHSDFLIALVSNDLTGFVRRADLDNRRRICDYVLWMSQLENAPAECWGSRAKYERWSVRGWIGHPGLHKQRLSYYRRREEV